MEKSQRAYNTDIELMLYQWNTNGKYDEVELATLRQHMKSAYDNAYNMCVSLLSAYTTSRQITEDKLNKNEFRKNI